MTCSTPRAQRHTPIIILATACATLLGANLMTNAGNLTPPDGAVTPTMSSLEEIESKLDFIVGNATVVPRYWEVVNSSEGVGENTWTPLIADGNGTIEAIILGGDVRNLSFRDGTGKSLFHWSGIVDHSPDAYFRMNIRYADGLEVLWNGGSPSFNVLFTPDV